MLLFPSPSRTFRLAFDTVADGGEHHQEAQVAQRGDGVVIEEAGDGDGKEDACAHDDGEDHGPEGLDGVENEELG